jgi:hypothetical protein
MHVLLGETKSLVERGRMKKGETLVEPDGSIAHAQPEGKPHHEKSEQRDSSRTHRRDSNLVHEYTPNDSTMREGGP